MSNPTIEVNLGEILKDIQNDQKKLLAEVNNSQKKLLEEVNNSQKKFTEEINNLQKTFTEEINDLKIGQAEIKGEMKALNAKVDQLDKRVANQEFLNRGVFIGLLLALLTGVINFFGWMPKS